ncbi:MAG: reverse transcriptase family protein [Planctomycetaceae bacterium]
MALLVVFIGFRLFQSGESTLVTDSGSTLRRAGLEPARNLDCAELCRRLQLPLETLQQHAPVYQTVLIPKAAGGHRRLEIPDEATRKLQRTILRRLLGSLSAHPCACGFERDTSIVDAAVPHVGRAAVVKMDIRRFFESTTSERVFSWFQSIGWDSEAATLLVTLTTCDGHLPQGAPTSPRLSNLVNAKLDETLLSLARRHRGVYTRYADDITMSFPFHRGRRLRGIAQAVRRQLRHYGYAMHGGAKLRFRRRHERQQVLGLVVNSRVNLPREMRRKLRSVRHHLETGRPATMTPQQLQGWEALQLMIATQRTR